MKLISILLGVSILAFLAIYSIKTYYGPASNKNSKESAINQAYDTERLTDLRAIQASLSMYYSNNYQYPNSLFGLVPQYASSLPSDPKSGKSYGYQKINSGYKLYCILDDQEKMQNDGGTDPNAYEIISN